MHVSLPSDFDPAVYLAINADVAMALESGSIQSAEQHYIEFGHKEERFYKPPTGDYRGIIWDNSFRYPYSSFGDLPEMAYNSPALAPGDDVIAERLISAWHRTRRSARRNRVRDPEGMWAARTRSFPSFHAALEDEDARALSLILSNMFQSHLTHGIAMGLSIATWMRHAQKHFAISWADRQLRLAEAVGAIPMRHPEQGGIDGPMNVIKNLGTIEQHLGFDLDFPNVGAPYGAETSRGTLPEHALIHAYSAWRIRKIVPRAKAIAEIGGGIGGLAYYMRLTTMTYTIFDLLFTNVLQGYFMLKSGLNVSLFGERGGQFRVKPWWTIKNFNRFDLVINQDSIPEMPLHDGEMYIKRIRQISSLFYSVNQEAAALNTDDYRQLIVSELVRKNSGYRLMHRAPFWLRDGYADELYKRALLARTIKMFSRLKFIK